MKKLQLLAVLGALGALGLPGAAYADQVGAAADLLCSRTSEVAEVRFGWTDDGGPPVFTELPRSLDAGLSAAPPSSRAECALRTGRSLRIRIDVGQARGYGMGGGDPPAAASLWINKRVVLVRRNWYPGRGTEKPWIAAVVVRSNELIFCSRPGDADVFSERRVKVSCRSEPLKVDAHPYDWVEFPRDGRPPPRPGTVSVAPGAADPSLCRSFLSAIRPRFDELTSGPGTEMPFDAKLTLDDAGAEEADWPGIGVASLVQGGPQYKIAMFSAEKGFFDGDVAVVAPETTPSSAIRALGKYVYKPIAAPEGWTIVSGGRHWIYPRVTPRYVHVQPVRVEGRLYFFIYPTDRENRPAALLVGLGHDLTLVPTCQFDEVQPNLGERAAGIRPFQGPPP